MVKKVTRKKSSKQLRADIAKLKKLKKEAKDRKALFLAIAIEREEIRKLRKEGRALKGVGSKRRIAGQVAKRLGVQAGKVGWGAAKFAGRIAKNILEAEAREQARESSRSKPKSKGRKKKR